MKKLNKVADQLAEEMARLADLADDDMLWELSHRSIFSAWKKGAVLWILNDQTWTRSIGDFVVWFCYYDLWSKVKVFGDMFKCGDVQEEVQRTGPKNMLDHLEVSFNELQLEALRLSLGKSKEGTKLATDMQNPMLSEEAKQKKTKDIEELQRKAMRKQQQLRGDAMQSQKRLADLEAKLLKSQADDIKARIAKFAEKEGYDLVLESAAARLEESSCCPITARR